MPGLSLPQEGVSFFSGAWWPHLEIDFLVSLEQRLTKLPLAGFPDIDKGHYPV